MGAFMQWYLPSDSLTIHETLLRLPYHTLYLGNPGKYSTFVEENAHVAIHTLVCT